MSLMCFCFSSMNFLTHIHIILASREQIMLCLFPYQALPQCLWILTHQCNTLLESGLVPLHHAGEVSKVLVGILDDPFHDRLVEIFQKHGQGMLLQDRSLHLVVILPPPLYECSPIFSQLQLDFSHEAPSHHSLFEDKVVNEQIYVRVEVLDLNRVDALSILDYDISIQ